MQRLSRNERAAMLLVCLLLAGLVAVALWRRESRSADALPPQQTEAVTPTDTAETTKPDEPARERPKRRSGKKRGAPAPTVAPRNPLDEGVPSL